MIAVAGPPSTSVARPPPPRRATSHTPPPYVRPLFFSVTSPKHDYPKVIREQVESPPLEAHPLIAAAAHSRSTAFSWWRQCARPCVTRQSPCTPNCSLYSSIGSAVFRANATLPLYVTLRRSVSLKNFSIFVGDLDAYHNT